MDNDNINSSSENSVFDEDGNYRIPHPKSWYSDASFSPAGENTEPVRFYTPEKKAEKFSAEESAHKEEKRQIRKSSKGAGITAVLCILCACIGCLAGIVLMNAKYAKNITDIQGRLAGLESEKKFQATSVSSETPSGKAPVSSADVSELSPSVIYSDACESVVGITSEVTYTNYFGMKSSSAVSGTGFVVSDDGYIVTNYHVIEDASKNRSNISAVFHDGNSYAADLVGYDADGDIAVLKIERSDCVPVAFGDSSSINVGDEVFAVGNPLGELSFSMTSGRISALDRSISTDSTSVPINMFQIDAPVNSGNSGGPLYSTEGKVIGVVTAKYSSNSVEGIGFVIPFNQALNIFSDLITKGYVTGKPYLGVMIDQRYTGTYSYYYGLPMGAYVNSVEKGSCADLSGIQSGDIITSIGGSEIDGYSDMQLALSSFRAGDTIDITVYHSSGSEQTLSVTLDENRGDTRYS